MSILFKKYKWYNKDGYAALMGVLVVGAVSASAVLSMLLLGIQSSQTSFTVQQSAQSRELADACVEEALQEIRDDGGYTGSESLSLSMGECQYAVTSSGGQSRTITSEGATGSIVRKVQLEIDGINPEINITSWQEVADF